MDTDKEKANGAVEAGKIIHIDQEQVRSQINEMVKQSVEG